MDLTAYDVLRALHQGNSTSEQLVSSYLTRINETNDDLNAVYQISSKALKDARLRDEQRKAGTELGPLHGVPVLIKAAFATDPYFDMDTISGNLALIGSRPRKNAVTVQKFDCLSSSLPRVCGSNISKLVDAGAIIIGTRTLSELSYWKISQIPAGWSPAAGQGQNPYIKGGRSLSQPVFSINGPGGSSSGPSIAVAAGYVPVAPGEETSGSLVFPADRAALYTIKATVGTVNQTGMVPISHRFDVAGPLAKSSHDVALFLDVLVDHTRVPPEGYVSCMKGASGWTKLRVGVLDPASWLYGDASVGWSTDSTAQIIREVSTAYQQIEARAKALTPVAFERFANGSAFNTVVGPLMMTLFEYDYRQDFDAYLSGVNDCKISSLADILTPDDKYAALRTPYGEYGRAALECAINSTISEETSHAAEASMRELSRSQGIDQILKDYNVDVILGPGSGPLYGVAAAAGYPIATLPLSYLNENGCPFGLVALASAFQEDVLVAVQSAWEQTFPARKAPPALE